MNHQSDQAGIVVKPRFAQSQLPVRTQLVRSFFALMVAMFAFCSLARSQENADESDAVELQLKRAKYQKALDESMSLEANDASLISVLSMMEKNSGVPITVDLAELKKAGVTVQMRVNLTARNLPMHDVLELLLKPTHTTYQVTDKGIEIPAIKSWIAIKYDIPDAEQETKIFVQQIGGEEIGSEELGSSKWSPLKNGKSLLLSDLKPGDYQVARMRLVDVAKAGDGRMQMGVYLDRHRFLLKSGTTKQIEFIRQGGRPVRGRVNGVKENDLDRALVYVCSPNATDSESLGDLDVTLFDARNCDVDGEFVTEPLMPGDYVIMVSGYEAMSKKDLFTTGTPVPKFIGSAKISIPEKGDLPLVKIQLQQQ